MVVWAMWPFFPAKTCFNLWQRPQDWFARQPLLAPKLLRPERAVAMAGGAAVVEGEAVRMPSFLSRRPTPLPLRCRPKRLRSPLPPVVRTLNWLPSQ